MLFPGFARFAPSFRRRTSRQVCASEAIGFEAYPLGGTLAELSFGPHAFPLQGYYVKEWAENTVMHVLVNDVHAWWQHIASLDLDGQFGVSSPGAPRVEPWGLTVTYLFDPSGVLWHFAERRRRVTEP
jgi:hypothetical protein